jgi:acetyl-CoA acetyltransferase
MTGDQDIWIIGAAMTKFGRFPDLDLLDLASDAAMSAIRDADTDLGKVGVLTMGNVYEAGSNNGQRLQKQIGQTGIPVYNVVNACATGATAVRVAMLSLLGGESDIALAVGVEQMGKMGLLGGAAKGKPAKKEFTPKGRYG